MTVVSVEQLTFTFEAAVVPFQYEQGGTVVAGWPHGGKVADVVAYNTPPRPGVLWVIEAKDFRVITNPPRPTNLGGLAESVAMKVRATLRGVEAVAASSTNASAQAHAAASGPLAPPRVVLHLEPHLTSGTHAALFPRGYAANVLMKLRQLLHDLDPKALVLDIQSTAAAGVPWTVT